MVSKWWIDAGLRRGISSIENLRRIKSIDFFVNSVRFNFNENTWIYRRLLVLEFSGLKAAE